MANNLPVVGKPVTIRIWDGCVVRYVFTVSPTGSSSIGAPGGAANGCHPDIEFDPWAGLIVDHRTGPLVTPVSIHHPEDMK